MSARTRTLFSCAPFNPNAVAAAKEFEDQSTHITDNNRDHGEIDSDLPSLDAALPSPPLMSTTEHQLESSTAEATKDEGHEVKSEAGSDVVMSPTWGVLLISPRSCGPAEEEEADAQQLWGDMTYGTRGHTYLADSSPDDTAEPTFSWESFFAAMRDNTLLNADIVAAAQ